MTERKSEIGDFVVYTVGLERYPARIVGISETTNVEVKIRVLDGPQAGTEFDAPWGIVEPYPGAIWSVGAGQSPSPTADAES
jgi:hypothetical protein